MNPYVTFTLSPRGTLSETCSEMPLLSDSYSFWLQLACSIPFSLDRVKEGVNTRLRAESAPLPEYLFSRSVAGASHVDIIRGLELASEGSLYGRFFCMYPDRVVPLTRWLAYWMKKGKFTLEEISAELLWLSVFRMWCSSLWYPVIWIWIPPCWQMMIVACKECKWLLPWRQRQFVLLKHLLIYFWFI